MKNFKSIDKRIYHILLWIILALSIVVLIKISPTLTKPEILPGDDFFHFWVGGYQNLQGKNPFDLQAIEQLRIQEGSSPTQAKISVILNPPWVLPLFMLFGGFKYSIARMIWLILSIGIILLSAQILWKVYSVRPNKVGIGILAAFIFSPTISALEKGQVTVFVLLGLTGFLYFLIVARNDWLAGVCLALVSFKPQVVLLFWFAVLFWTIQQHRWVIIFSMAITILALTLVTIAFNPMILQQYYMMLQTYQISDWANPTIGAYLRFFWLGIDKFWLQYLPSLFGIFWFVFYWFHHNKPWNWVRELPILVLASIIISPYAWTYDQVILIPAIIQVVAWVAQDWKRTFTLFMIIAYLALNLLNLWLHMRLDDFWFIWFAPGLLTLYLIIQRQYFRSSGSLPLTNRAIG